MTKPLRVSQVDLSKIIYQNIKGRNKKYIPIDYETSGNKLVIQTPLLYCNVKPVKKDGFYELDIPLYGKSSSKVEKFVNLLKQLDMKFMNDAKKNGKTWFVGKKNIRYKSIFRDVNDTSRIYENGLIKIKILSGMNGATITQNGKEINPSDLCVNQQIRLLLEVSALWLSEEGFGLYLRPHLIDQHVLVKYQFSFLESDSDSDILDTEIGPGNDEQADITPFIKDSDTSTIQMNDKNINNVDEKHIEMIESDSNSDILKTEVNDQVTETNDESTYNDTSIVTDYNNMKKKN